MMEKLYEGTHVVVLQKFKARMLQKKRWKPFVQTLPKKPSPKQHVLNISEDEEGIAVNDSPK